MYLLSLFEVILERIREPLGVFDKLPFPLLECSLSLGSGDVGRHFVHRVQQLLNGTGYLPEKINKPLECLEAYRSNTSAANITHPTISIYRFIVGL